MAGLFPFLSDFRAEAAGCSTYEFNMKVCWHRPSRQSPLFTQTQRCRLMVKAWGSGKQSNMWIIWNRNWVYTEIFNSVNSSLWRHRIQWRGGGGGGGEAWPISTDSLRSQEKGREDEREGTDRQAHKGSEKKGSSREGMKGNLRERGNGRLNGNWASVKESERERTQEGGSDLSGSDGVNICSIPPILCQGPDQSRACVLWKRYREPKKKTDDILTVWSVCGSQHKHK